MYLSKVPNTVIGEVVYDLEACICINNLQIYRTFGDDARKMFKLSNGNKTAQFDTTLLVVEAIISELRASFMSSSSFGRTVFFVQNSTGFNIAHFALFTEPHPTDEDTRSILVTLLSCDKTFGAYNP